MFNVRGQRHIFEAQNQVAAARFAQRWADQEAGRTPVTSGDIQRRLGLPPSQFGADVGARVNQDVANLNNSIDDVRAHPANLLNAQKVLSAVSRYAPNALGLAPAADLDQVTGPVVRGINARFGSHFDPRNTTDQILNAAGLLAGGGEFKGLTSAEKAQLSALAEAGQTSARRELLTGPGEPALPRLLTAPVNAPMRQLTTHIGKQLLLESPKAKPNLTVAYEAPVMGDHVLGQNSNGENVVPLSDSFIESHDMRKESLSDLPEELQYKYLDPIEDLIFNPILDDPDYGGHTIAAIKDIESHLNTLAEAHRSQGGGNARIGDALAEASQSLQTMVAEQQPEMAKELGYLPEDEPGPAWGAQLRPLPASSGSKPANVMRFDRYVEPPEDPNRLPPDLHAEISKLSREQRAELVKQWTAMRDAGAQDAAPALPEGVIAFPGRKFIRPPTAEEAEAPEQPPQDSSSEIEATANDDAATDPEEESRRNLPALWSAPGVPAVWNPPRAQLPAIWNPPRVQLPVLASRPANAFSAQQGLEWTVVPPAPRPKAAFDFNALRPPQWAPLGMVTTANLPQGSRQPQN